MDVLALIVAGAALGFSVYTYFRQFPIQRGLAEIEKARRVDEVSARLEADVTAAFESFITSQGHTNHQLVLANRGPARAEEVSFEILDPADGQAPTLIMQGHNFPIPLDPGQDYAILGAATMGTAPSVDIILRWSDGTGSREKRMALTVFGR